MLVMDGESVINAEWSAWKSTAIRTSTGPGEQGVKDEESDELSTAPGGGGGLRYRPPSVYDMSPSKAATQTSMSPSR